MRSCRVWVVLAVLCAGGLRAEEAKLPAGFKPLRATPEPQSDLALTVQGEAPLQLLFGLQDPLHGYRLRLATEAAVLERLNGQVTELGRGKALSGAGPHKVLLRRRESSLYVVLDDRLAIEALDGSYKGGSAAVSAAEAGRVAVPEGGYQPVEDIYFSDDFMRTKDQQQLGVWRHVSGKWRFYSVLETNERADVNLSVNPFSLGLDSDGTTPACVVTGTPFWCDYHYAASVRSRGGAWAGLLFAQRDAKNYYLLRADLRERPARPRRIELVRVTDGTETVLTGGTTLLSADQWYRLGVRLRGARVQCLLDGDVIFDRIEPGAYGGPVGLWSSGAGGETLFDDVKCETNLEWRLDRKETLGGPSVVKTGDWRLEATKGDPIGNDPGPQRLSAAGLEPARYVLGDPAGQQYRLDAAVQPQNPGRVAVLFGWQDARNYWSAEWDTPRSRLSLARTTDGVTRPVGSVTDALEPGAEHTVALDLNTDGRIQVRRDGLLRMRAEVEQLPTGRFGFQVSETPASFSGIQLRQYVPIDTEVEIDNSHFSADPYMLHWASSLADWFPKGDPATEANHQQVYWHKGDFYRSYKLELPLATPVAVLMNATEERWLPPADGVVTSNVTRIAEVADKQYEGDGYALHIIPGAQGASLHLFRRGEAVKEATMPAGIDVVTVGHDGGVTWVEAGGKDVLVYHDHDPLTGPRVALRVKSNDELFHVKCRREGIIDEVFEQAPAQWVQQGNWEITNRFSCTPTWSHMTALERKGLGALWNKAAFPGNVTVEYYAGMRMQSDYSMIYPRPGDFNCTFAAQPFDLASGISLLPGAWDPAWSSSHVRYVHGNDTLVDTDRPLVPRTRENSGQRYIPVPYIAGGRDIHGAWYYVKSRSIDGKLEGFFDNVKVLETSAPAVNGDRVAIWTQDNQVVLARIRITYQDKVVPRRLISEDPVVPAPSYPAPVVLTCDEAPGVAYSFEDSLDGWTARDPWRGVRLELGTDQSRHGLVVHNELPGDSFEAVMPLGSGKAGQPESLDLGHAAVLRFDYRIPPETHVNAYLTLSGKRYVIPLTGSQEDSPVTPVLLRPAAVLADGQWHSLRLPLGAALRREFGPNNPKLTDFRFGNLQEGYLLAGFGGNGRGAWYALDNLAIVPEAPVGKPLTAHLTVLPQPGATAAPSVKTVRLALDRNPSTVPAATATAPLTPPAEPGVWYLHAQAVLQDGSVTGTAHQPVLVADKPQLQPVDATQPWNGGPLRLAFEDFAPSSLSLTVADKPLTWAQGVRVDAENRQLVVDPSAAGLSLSDNQLVTIKYAAEYASGLKAEGSFQRVYSRAADQVPPSAPVVTGATWYADATPTSVPWTPATGSVAVGPDPHGGTPAGAPAARICNLTAGGSMSVNLATHDAGINLANRPLLMFDYRMPQPVRADLGVSTPGQWNTVSFTDESGAYPVIGAITDPKRDDQWHRTTFNLQRALAAQSPFGPTMYQLASLVTADYGYSGAAPGASWWLDHLRLVQLVGQHGVTLNWSAYDAGGIARWRYGWSLNEQAEPTTEADAVVVSKAFTFDQDGLMWFALQAQDNAGNWSPVTRVPVLVKRAPPVFGAPSPAPGPLGTWNLQVPVSQVDPADLDPTTLSLSVNNTEAQVVTGEVTYQPGKSLDWNWAWASHQFGGRVADGTELKFALHGKDGAGNEAAPLTWAAKVSYAADKQPPLAPDVTVAGQHLASLETCTRGLGSMGDMTLGYRSPRQRVLDPERNDYVCQVTTGGQGVPLAVGTRDLVKDPYLSFDYKLSAGVALHLLVYVRDAWRSVFLNGSSRSYQKMGAADIRADGKWHTLVLDLQSIARSVFKDSQPLTTYYVVLDENGSSGGQSYWLDNVASFGPMPKGNLPVSFVDYDATGIQGSALSLDTNLDAAAPEALVADQVKAEPAAPQPGTYLLQVRCKDGAGNWGGTARRVVVVP